MIADTSGNQYTYDCENQLISITLADDTEITYKYDAFGRRVEKTVDDGETETTTKFIYDGFQVIAECDGGGALLRKYVYGPGIDKPLALVTVDGQTETWYYYHFNDLGSVIALSDENGDLVESYLYDVFGEPTICDGDGDEITASAVDNPYMFTGRRYEQETGLYYYRLRDYNPAIGRFMQNDPLGYIGWLNLYQYCNNNPVNWIDPLGLFNAKSYIHILMNMINIVNPLASWTDDVDNWVDDNVLLPLGEVILDVEDAVGESAEYLYDNVYTNPRFQGGLQAAGGAAGAVIGTYLTAQSGGSTAPYSVPMMIGGCYEFGAGLGQLISGDAAPDTYLGALASPLGGEASEYADCIQEVILRDPDSLSDTFKLLLELADYINYEDDTLGEVPKKGKEIDNNDS